MFRHLVAGAAGIAAVAALTVAPAEAAAYGVTLTASTVKADVNTTFKLSGKVTGSGAGRKSIIVQRKIGSAAWKNYSTITTRQTGTYSKAFTMASVGAKSFRVLVPKSGKLTTGTSNTVEVTGYTWLALVNQPLQHYGTGAFNVVGRVNGETYAKSIVMYGEGGYYFDVDSKCDRVSLGFGLDERTSGSLEQPFSAGFADSNGTTVLADNTADIALAKIDQPLTPSAEFLYFGRDTEVGSNKYVAVTTPKVHCTVTQLPEVELFN